MSGTESEKTENIKLSLRKIHVKGFKSLRDVELDLSGSNLVVLVGANGTGKTNIIELFLFLRRALHDELKRQPYAPHAEWGNPRNLTWEAAGVPIHVILEYQLEAERGGNRFQEKLIYTVIFAPDPAFATIRPVYEKVELPGLGYVLERHENRLVTRFRVGEAGKGLRRQFQKCFSEANVECSEDECSIMQDLKEGKNDIPPVLVSSNTIIRGKCFDKSVISDIVIFANCCIALILFPANKFNLSAGLILRLLNRWFGNIVVLRQVDYSIAKWPHNRYSDMMLRPHAENLAEMLYRTMRSQKGRERIEAAISTLFPWLEVRVEFNKYGQIGLVFYEKRGEKSIELYPSMVPDGVIKLLSIIVAAALEPSLLAIDEIENSLHARLIDYLMRELEEANRPAILATHSPIVVDLAGPERTLLLRRAPDGSTKIEKLAPEDLWEKMKEDGLTLSDYYLYAAT